MVAQMVAWWAQLMAGKKVDYFGSAVGRLVGCPDGFPKADMMARWKVDRMALPKVVQ